MRSGLFGKGDAVYLIGKSTGKDSVSVVAKGGTFDVKMALAGVGGEFSGSAAEAKSWLKSRLQGMGSAMSGNEMTDSELAAKLKLVKGEDALEIFAAKKDEKGFTWKGVAAADIIKELSKDHGTNVDFWNAPTADVLANTPNNEDA